MNSRIYILIKEYFFYFIFTFYFKISKKNKSPITTTRKYKKILIIRFGGIGYALSLTPLIHQLKESLNCSIFILVDKQSNFVYRNNPSVDKIFIYSEGIKDIVDILRLIRYENFDIIINTHQEYSPLNELFISFSDIPHKYGFSHKYHRIYSKSIKYDNSESVYPANNILKLGTLLGCTHNNEPQCKYYPAENNIIRAKQFISKKFTGNKFIVGINISTANERNNWKLKYFRDLILKLNNFNINCLIISTTRGV